MSSIGQRHVLVRLAHGPDGGGVGEERAEELGGVLRLLHADDQVQGPVGPVRERSGERHPGAWVVTAIEPKFPARRQFRREQSVQALHPRRPLGPRQTGIGGSRASFPSRAGRRRRCRRCRSDGGRAVTALADRSRLPGRCSAGRRRPGSICQSRPRASSRRAGLGGAPGPAPTSTSVSCAPVTTGMPGFMMPAFSAAMAASVSPSKSRWSMRDRGDGAGGGRDHVGRVAASAEAHFEHAELGRNSGEEQEGGGGDHLEDGDRRAAIHPLDRL